MPKSHSENEVAEIFGPTQVCEDCQSEFEAAPEQTLCGSCLAKLFADQPATDITQGDLVFGPEPRRSRRAGIG